MSNPDSGSITGLVPMIYVADVERAAAFYRVLGLQIGNAVPRGDGPKQWAWLYAPAAPDWKRGPNLMLTRTSGEARPRDVTLYLYASDLQAIRSHMLGNGLTPSEISYPEYLPDGELCLQDPDGHTVMVAQSVADTP